MARKKKISKQGHVGEGGAHQHQADPMDTTRTQFDGAHSHWFLINGHLLKTEMDGHHWHPLVDSLSGKEQPAHAHAIYIGEDLMDTRSGTPHEHALMNGGVTPTDGPHRHDLELLDGTVITSLLPEDLMDVQVRKKMEIDIQAVVLSKDRFLTFERAAAWVDEHDFNVDNFVEHRSEFIFVQSPREEFEESSLKTMDLLDGVKAIVGIEKEEEDEAKPFAPEADQEEATFDSLQALLVSESPILTDMQVEQLADLRDDLKQTLAMIKEAAFTALPLVMTAIERVASADMQAMVALLDRAAGNAQAVQSVLEKIALPQVELVQEAHVSELVEKAAGMCSEMADVFEDTSFERLQLLLKSCALTFNKAAAKVWEEPKVAKEEPAAPAPAPEVKKNLAPTKEMTRVEKQAALQERAREFEIEVTSDASLMFPAGFTTDLNKFGDPVNLKFPCDTEENAKKSRKRFKKFADEVYKSTDSKAEVHERIVRLSLALGMKVEVDPDDNLDALLPTNILATKVDQGPEISSENQPGGAPNNTTEELVDKTIFVPIRKLAGEQRIVCGVVLEPDVTDLHGDTYDEETVREAAWTFMEDFMHLGLMHDELIDDKVRILESYCAPTNMALPTDTGAFNIRKGTWLMTWRIKDDGLWDDVKSGALTGFSIGAKAQVTNLRKVLQNRKEDDSVVASNTVTQ